MKLATSGGSSVVNDVVGSSCPTATEGLIGTSPGERERGETDIGTEAVLGSLAGCSTGAVMSMGSEASSRRLWAGLSLDFASGTRDMIELVLEDTFWPGTGIFASEGIAIGGLVLTTFFKSMCFDNWLLRVAASLGY